jgi:hypothetical protein
VLSLNSGGHGFNFEGGEIALRDVVVAGAYGYGIFANTSEGGTLKLTVDRTTLRGNEATGIAAVGAGIHVVISCSTLTGNAAYTFYLAGGGVIKSTGDNTVEGNGAGTILGGSLTTLTKQ